MQDSSTLVSAHNIIAGTYRELVVSNSDIHGIYQMAFTAGDAAISVANFSITQRASKPAYIAPDPTTGAERVYKKYLEITSNLTSVNVKGGFSIFFKIDKAWMADNNFDRNHVKLMRWNNNAWQTLDAAFLRDNSSPSGSYNFYESTTPGFSIFAIVAGPASSPGTVDSNAPHIPPEAPAGGPDNGASGVGIDSNSGDTNAESAPGGFSLPGLPEIKGDTLFLIAAGILVVGILGGIFYFALFHKASTDAKLDAFVAQKNSSAPKIMGSSNFIPASKFSFSLPKLEWPFGKKDSGLAGARAPEGNAFGSGLRVMESNTVPREKITRLFKNERGLADSGIKWPEFLRKK